MATKVENIKVIYTDDTYLYELFGVEDHEEITLTDDMDDYIYEYIQENIEDGTFIDENDESVKYIREFQALIRKQLRTAKQVQVRYKENIQ